MGYAGAETVDDLRRLAPSFTPSSNQFRTRGPSISRGRGNTRQRSNANWLALERGSYGALSIELAFGNDAASFCTSTSVCTTASSATTGFCTTASADVVPTNIAAAIVMILNFIGCTT